MLREKENQTCSLLGQRNSGRGPGSTRAAESKGGTSETREPEKRQAYFSMCELSTSLQLIQPCVCKANKWFATKAERTEIFDMANCRSDSVQFESQQATYLLKK